MAWPESRNPEPGGEHVTVSWLRPLARRPGSSQRLVCFPHGGASASFYREWPEETPLVDVYGVQYPGRGDRFNEPLVDDVRESAWQIAGAVAPLTDRPVTLFGHSVGAILAYETARFLEGEGYGVDCLFVSGARAPHDPQLGQEACAALDDDALASVVGRLGGADAEFLANRELRDVVLPVVRNDYRAVETYEHRSGQPLRCRLVSVVGERAPLTTPQDAMLWGDLTQNNFALHTFSGGHFYLAQCRTDLIRIVLGHLTDREDTT